MRYSVLFIFTIACIIGACKNNERPSVDQSTKKTSDINYDFEQKHDANGYFVFIKAKNGERTTVLIESKGLSPEFQQSFTVEGQVKETFMLDIDNNGHKEFYLAISPTDDTGNIDLKAFVSDASNHISEATVMDEKLGMREMNSDQVTAESGGLVRRFNINGKTVAFKYMLMQSEASYLLIPTLNQ